MDKKKALNALSALSQETRLDTFRLLIKAGPDGLFAGNISEELNVLQNTMSSHLAILENAGLIVKTRQGRSIRYTANYPCMRDLLLYLLQDCCGCAYKDIDDALETLLPRHC